MGVSLTPLQVAETKAALDRNPGNIAAVARELGIARSTAQSRMAALASGRYEFENGPICEPKLSVSDVIQTKPRIRVKAYTQQRITEEYTPERIDEPVIRVLALGDIHKKPGRTDEPVILAARHAAATRPDRIVSIGDWLSLDSCSFHSAKGSAGDMARPTFAADLEAGEESLWAFDRYAPDVPRDITLGNHCHRAWRVAEMDPKMMGDAPLRVQQLFARYRFKTHDFGKFLNIGGVLFTHVPLNNMGRPYGGKHSENTLAADSARSLVWGHDHRFRFKSFYRIGDAPDKIQLCNLGTCMPFGVVEDYNVGTTGWTYGAVDLSIQAGQIISARFHDLRELKDRYGD
jgi:hypothetical protein